jgi:hypothetical protein
MREEENLAKTQNSAFEQAFLEAMDEGFLILGESGREAIYFHLKKECSAKREEFADKPEILVDGLAKIFGVGAQVIEKAILKSLYCRLEQKFKEKKGYGFLSYLREVKQAFEEEEKME